MGVVEPWSQGHSDMRLCRTCRGQADRKPLPGCTEPKHQQRYETKRELNNQYRRQRRSDARSTGTVYRGGRGNPDRKAQRERERHQQIREVLFERLGVHVCSECGFPDKRALHFDHVNGGGRRHRKSLPSGSAYYRALMNMSLDELRAAFQVLCANCNAIKREEREEWRWRHASEVAAQEDEGLPPSS